MHSHWLVRPWIAASLQVLPRKRRYDPPPDIYVVVDGSSDGNHVDILHAAEGNADDGLGDLTIELKPDDSMTSTLHHMMVRRPLPLLLRRGSGGICLFVHIALSGAKRN